jgi:uncharacterized Fe-S cluster-containing radical SAM superfamily enzyme
MTIKMEKNKMKNYDYASVLFSGKCNAHCHECIGKYPEFLRTPQNLDSKQLKGLEKFIERVNTEEIKYISLSGVNSDPQQYKFEANLIKELRTKVPNAVLSLHSNGRFALQKTEEFNSYDKATLSFPSFNKEVYKKIMGVESINLYKIVKKSRIPIKLSMLLTEHNQREIEDYIKNAKKLGISRVIIRKVAGKENKFKIFEEISPIKTIFKNPVYQIGGVEVTVWNYAESNIKGLYLFPDGTLRNKFRQKDKC